MKQITLENYQSDPNYPRIVQAVAKILDSKDVVSPVDLFIHLGILSYEAVDDWRFGRIPFLERVVCCNLSKASRILRIFRMHVHDLNMKPSQTVYSQYGAGQKRTLRFSKTGDPKIEAAYARHFVRNVSKRKTERTSSSPIQA